jgi:hypothetical protein
LPAIPGAVIQRDKGWQKQQETRNFPVRSHVTARKNGSVRKRAIQLENLISTRICSRGRQQHMLANQCLIRVGGESFASSVFLAMVVAKHFLAVTVCFFIFWPPLLTVFKSFTPFRNFFTLI